MKGIIIAIDGYSGTGKSSTAKQVARALGYTYIDTGAMYRAATLFFLEKGVDMGVSAEVDAALKSLTIKLTPTAVLLNGTDVTHDIRTMRVNESVSQVSAQVPVREEMVAQQRAIGLGRRVVMDGRDIGTVVFPEAELKVFMSANLDVRAERRQQELKAKGIDEGLDTIKENLAERDRVDSTREASPLKKAPEAVEIDTSHMEFDDQVARIVQLAKERIDES